LVDWTGNVLVLMLVLVFVDVRERSENDSPVALRKD
jgi:hypothetical protein